MSPEIPRAGGEVVERRQRRVARWDGDGDDTDRQ